MTVKAFRLTKTTHVSTAFSGEGARKYGGRWNSPGHSVVYTSSTLSLAMLEIMVHLDDYATLRKSYSFIEIDIPSDLILSVDASVLPEGWSSGPPARASQQIGDAWIDAGGSAVLSVPTVVVPDERNYLLNPHHPDFPKIAMGTSRQLSFDLRFIK